MGGVRREDAGADGPGADRAVAVEIAAIPAVEASAVQDPAIHASAVRASAVVAKAAQGRGRAAAEAGLEVTGQFLAFEPGLYAVDVVAARSVATDVGLRLPCVRLEPLPSVAGAGQAFVSGAAEGGWLAGGATAFVLVVGGRTRVMLSVYKAAGGMASPELLVRPLGTATGLAGADAAGAAARASAAPDGPQGAAIGEGGAQGAAPALATAAPSRQAAVVPVATKAETSTGAGGSGLVLLAHVQGVGDLFADARGWAGRAGSRAPVEGFSVAAEGVDAGEIEYQAILGDQWNTPWTQGGGFCGSRGMALPILGFRVRLVGAAAGRLECRYWGAFVGRGEVGPLGDGAACQTGQAFLEALRVVVVPRAGQDVPVVATGAVRGKAPQGQR